MGFQNRTNLDLPYAVAGDFAGSNPRASYPSGEGGHVAGAGGVTVARFAWIQADGKTVLNADASAVPHGFIHREQQALITTFLGESSNVVPVGLPVTVMRTGDYYVTATVGAATAGQKAFAKLTDGTMQAAAAGATVSGYVETPFTITRGALVGEVAVMTL